MKNLKNSDFEKYNDIVDTVEKCIRGEGSNSDVIDSIFQMEGYQEFLDNVSSEKVFINYTNKMNNAVKNINTQKLINSIRNVEKKRRIRRRNIIGSISFAAALIAICFIVYNPNTTNLLNENDVATVTSKKNPILIIGDSVVEVNKLENRIIATDYISDNNNIKEVIPQRLIIPSGQTYTVILLDGSEVMLNACSELSYPSYFGENAREVTLKGEAYFKVAKSDKPFIVNVDKSYIKVYGTSFNVDAKSENEIKAVLVEGRIGIGSEDIKEIFITPNQLATLNLKDNTSSVKNIDVENYLGWKSGYFKCIDNDITQLIDDLSLWYDVEFNYDKLVLDDFKVNISINRNLPITEALRYIEEVTELKFIKKQNKIYDIEY